MHAPGFPTLSSVALAAKSSSGLRATSIATRAAAASVVGASNSTSDISSTGGTIPWSAPRDRSPVSFSSRRRYHTSPSRARSPNPSSPWKPGIESLFEDDATASADESQAGVDSGSGRLRPSSTGLRRRLLSRQRAAYRLPPVRLPASFYQENVSLFEPESEPKIPLPLVRDASYARYFCAGQHEKEEAKAREQVDRNDIFKQYFSDALDVLLERNQTLFNNFENRSLGETPAWNSSSQIAKLVRLCDMILDASSHLIDSIDPKSYTQYVYKGRPFWWWNIHQDLEQAGAASPFADWKTKASIRHLTEFAENTQFSLAHSMVDFPPKVFLAMSDELRLDLKSAAPSTFDSKTAKRPIQILSLSGHGGKSVAQSIGAQLAFHNQADVIHLDAYDISYLIGPYIGQDWVYSRGAVSTLGFRAAELSGRIAKEGSPHIGASIISAQEEDDGDESGGIHVRLPSSSWEQELQRRKNDGSDCFTDSENAKINKVIDHLVNDAISARGDRPALIHVHDFVELSMTEEGSAILNKLRTRVDAAWKKGKSITLVGTSACEHPSDEYQGMVQHLSTSDLVLSRHIQCDQPTTPFGPEETATSLRGLDTMNENVRNINRAIAALQPDAEPQTLPQWDISERDPVSLLPEELGGSQRIYSSVLPLPEVCSLAKTFTAQHGDDESSPTSFRAEERLTLGPMRQSAGHSSRADALQSFLQSIGSDKPAPPSSSGPWDESRSDANTGTATARPNEYEKRISSGIIKRENLRITFADVHVAPETTNALKLLTSLALLRPDAFSYGVLAHDKINGCLLYGPPGTGKTMLAKAVAKESGANMIEISGASVNDKWVGETEKLIRAVFTLAKKLSPCVVFIDEADALLANRSMFSSRASHRENLNQFLKEWDGMEETNAFIMVATNRPFDLDDAVLRRLPRKLLIDLPLRDDRAAILRLLLRGEQLAPEISLEDIADRTPFYSGSDLKNMCVAAAMVAVEDENKAANAWQGSEPYQYPERRVLQQEHFERALKQIPASISEDMETLRLIRRFDEEYGNRRKGGGKKTMGFGGIGAETKPDTASARVRQQGP